MALPTLGKRPLLTVLNCKLGAVSIFYNRLQIIKNEKKITDLLISATFTLAGCEQLSGATGKVGESINSSLSSLRGVSSPSNSKSTTLASDNLAVNTVHGLGAICRDYEANAMAGKKNWIGKKISISDATVLEAQEAYDTKKYFGAQRDHKTYAIIFQTPDINYCSVVLL